MQIHNHHPSSSIRMLPHDSRSLLNERTLPHSVSEVCVGISDFLSLFWPKSAETLYVLFSYSCLSRSFGCALAECFSRVPSVLTMLSQTRWMQAARPLAD